MSELVSTDLQPGDAVVVLQTHRATAGRVRKVLRVTATQIVLDNGSRFRRSNLREMGAGQWSTSKIVRIDSPEGQQAVQAIRIARARNRTEQAATTLCRDESIENIDELIKQAQEYREQLERAL